MEDNDLKQVWKAGTQQGIRAYSDTELKKMILKSARQSMKAIQPTGLFQIVVIAVMVYCAWNLFFRHPSMEMKLVDAAGLAVLAVCYFLWKRKAYQMNRYTCDKPLKAWLEERIREVEKTTRRGRFYTILTLAAAFVLGFSFYAVTQWLLQIPFNPWRWGGILLGLLVYLLLVYRSLSKKHKKTLEELKALYSQFEE